MAVMDANSTSCPSPECRPLKSEPGGDAEVVAEFTCSDGALYRCDPPYAKVAESVQRALIEPTWLSPDVPSGVLYRTDTQGDGWYEPCALTDFQGERLMDPVSTTSCETLSPWVCVCPLEEATPADPELKIRTPNTTYALGEGIGYRNSTFTVYTSGYYVVSSPDSRNLTYLESGSVLENARAVEWASRPGNFTIMQVVNGSLEHEVGAWFNWTGDSLTIPYRSIWEFVLPIGSPAAWFAAEECVIPFDAWCVTRLEAGVSVWTNASSFFIRDVTIN